MTYYSLIKGRGVKNNQANFNCVKTHADWIASVVIVKSRLVQKSLRLKENHPKMIKTTFWTKNICVQTNDEFLTQNNSGSKRF